MDAAKSALGEGDSLCYGRKDKSNHTLWRCAPPHVGTGVLTRPVERKLDRIPNGLKPLKPCHPKVYSLHKIWCMSMPTYWF